MSQRTLRPGLTAAMAAGRGLLAAGWRYDSTSPMADDSTIRTLLHPSGREINARTSRHGDSTALTMTGLDLVQVAGAITGAGLTASEQPEHSHIAGSGGGPGQCSAVCTCGVTFDGFDTIAEADALLADHIAQATADPDDYWLRLAASLHEVADRIATLAGTDSGPHASANLYLRASLFDSDADRAIPIINAIADALGVSTETKTEGRGTSRRTKRRMKLSANKLDVVAYADVPNPPTAAEKRATLAAQNEALRARVAELETQVPSMAMSPRSGHCPKHGTWTGPDGCTGCARIAGRHA
jgi:hypothetical protein